jgi:hypothetical protein
MIERILNFWRNLGSRVKQHLKQWTKPATTTLVTETLSDMTRSRADLIAENAMLRQQLIVRAAVTRSPSNAWTVQQLREATPWGKGPKCLIRDRDSKYGGRFSIFAASSGIKELKTPFQAPKANACFDKSRRPLRALHRYPQTRMPGPRAYSPPRPTALPRRRIRGLLQSLQTSSGHRAAHPRSIRRGTTASIG